MRPLWKDIFAAVWIGMIIPGMVLNVFVIKQRHRHVPQTEAAQVATDVNHSRTVPIRDPDGTLTYMELESYLTGVLLAEMPAEFHTEALKAQSVAARTYTWKANKTGGKHKDGSVCTDSVCCQAYLSEEAYRLRGGTSENLEKIRTAVLATSPFVLAYDGELIEATYFSSSGGSTETALAVWGTDYPYLQAVSSPEEEAVSEVSYTPEEFQYLLGKTFSGNPKEWFGSVTYTEGGGVATLEICGECYTGVQLRSMLGLRSTMFHLLPGEDFVSVRTKGYGHRVGMSQYGANAMAESGSNWQKILQHYYPGTILYPID